MATSARRNPSEEGFLRLLPDPKTHTLKYHIEEIQRLAREARSSSKNAREAYLDAILEEESGYAHRALMRRSAARLDHVRAVDHLHGLALAVRAMMRWVALDWRPHPDVVGTNLSPAELRELCAVMGRPDDAEEWSDDGR